MDSAAQDQWVEIAETIRQQIAKRIQYMPEMTNEGIKDIIAAAQAAYWLEINAAAFDKHLDEARNKFA
jgi:hypothetical protein